MTCITTAEAATMLNVTEHWLLDQLRARRFAGRKMGGKWRMTDSDIAAAIDACAVPARPPREIGYKPDSLVADSLTARVRCTAAPRTPLSAVYTPLHRPRSEQRSPCPRNAEERHRCLSHVLCPVERLSWCR